MTDYKTIDAKEIYQKLEARGISIKRKSCCGKQQYRKDFDNMLHTLCYAKGKYKVVDNGVIVSLVDIK